ncbi:MAG TPA: 30S ribosomal protein S17 [Candidatus Paceibacterota bacterium]
MSLFTKKTKEKKAVAAKAEVKVTEPKQLTGIVTSTKMKDTIVVRVNRFVKHAKYERFVKISKKYKAHDAGNTKKEGETVTIVECAPISKDKHFKVLAA